MPKASGGWTKGRCRWAKVNRWFFFDLPSVEAIVVPALRKGLPPVQRLKGVGHLLLDPSVLLIGRQPLFVAGMRSALCGRRFCRIIDAAGGQEGAAVAVARLRPDAVILEIDGEDGAFAIIPRILKAQPEARLIVVAASENGEHAMRALEAGAAGYLTSRSTPEELVEATRLVLGGQTFVSPTVATRVIAAMRQAAARQAEQRRTVLNLREEQIALHLLKGQTNREIAASLGLREKTVKHYMTLLMQKFDVRNRLELALHLRQRGGAPAAHDARPGEPVAIRPRTSGTTGLGKVPIGGGIAGVNAA